MQDYVSLEPKLVELAQQAGQAILAIYNTEFEVEAKSDKSPLTEADLAAHRVIEAGLTELTPDIPIISEEAALPSFDQRQEWNSCWLVDPLDGTKEFVKRNGNFTVNIALIERGEPVLGVVGVPVQDTVYIGNTQTQTAYVLRDGARSDIRTRTLTPGTGLTAVVSASHADQRTEAVLSALAQHFPEIQRQSIGSSLKLCMVATGDADFYPRLGPTSEWDIAAAHAVLSAAGGDVRHWDGHSFRYNTKESLLNPEFVAIGDRDYPWRERLPELPSAD